ncbi:hypothetical protein CPB84DRAFT_1779810 [Gymnopilus junonius]|uniref:Uncharacterized protein n=1 Tax=Gymnopilus junonius TaxID=109634 RepID=A0A9P5NMC7_GYMJU|nr:hypothetical protein CPB84DRAFT_1779810 [Gymnopilus junonius]
MCLVWNVFLSLYATCSNYVRPPSFSFPIFILFHVYKPPCLITLSPVTVAAHLCSSLCHLLFYLLSSTTLLPPHFLVFPRLIILAEHYNAITAFVRPCHSRYKPYDPCLHLSLFIYLFHLYYYFFSIGSPSFSLSYNSKLGYRFSDSFTHKSLNSNSCPKSHLSTLHFLFKYPRLPCCAGYIVQSLSCLYMYYA